MDENLKNGQDVILIKDKGKGTIQAVSGVDEQGNLKTDVPNSKNPDFLKIDKSGNALENFFSNLQRQYADPTRFEFFKIPMNMLEKALNFIKVSPEKLNEYKVEHPKQGNKLDESRIDWDKLKEFGISKEMLEKAKCMDALTKWGKTPVVIQLTINVGDDTLKPEARMSFRETPEGEIKANFSFVKSKPDFDNKYGLTFTDEDKKSLLSTGNAGRVMEFKPHNGEPFNVFVSVDPLTNHIVAVKEDRIKTPDEVLGAKLDAGQKKQLSEGKPVFVEGMTSKTGKTFDATIQINADKRGIDFKFGDQQNQQNKNTVRIPQNLLGVDLSDAQKDKLKNGEPALVTGMASKNKSGETFDAYINANHDKGKLDFIPVVIRGKEISESEAKQLCAGKTLYVADLKDNKGNEYNGYLSFNPEQAKVEYSKDNPNLSNVKDITPDNAGKTQVAVNTDGKTNEATKKVEEPLKKGQTQPTEKQKEKSEEKKQESKPKSKGRKL